jgi:mono/diheme cytochrome c family protein
MRRAVRLIVVTTLLLVALVVVAGFIALEVRSTRRFDAPYPAIRASTQAGLIDRGRYLVYGPAGCAYCHVPKEDWPRLDRGEFLPLTGGHVFRLPLGELYSANLTTDRTTGIGRRTDGELARTLRHGVRADGRAAMPLMEYQRLSDDDLTAIVSFLRSQPGIAHEVPAHRLSTLGKMVMAFAYEPEGPSAPPQAASPSGLSIARGEYLANDVAGCVSCHTDRSERDGSLVGPRFAGGQRLDVAADPGIVLVTPNLTPDPKTSVIGVWSEDMFVARFRAGERLAGTIMPWGAFARMTDDDLRSVYRYLRSLTPVEHQTGPVVQAKQASSGW